MQQSTQKLSVKQSQGSSSSISNKATEKESVQLYPSIHLSATADWHHQIGSYMSLELGVITSTSWTYSAALTGMA